jgi:hypothetical protein
MLTNLESASQQDNSDSDNSRGLVRVLTPEQVEFAVVVGRAISESWRAEQGATVTSLDTKATHQ